MRNRSEAAEDKTDVFEGYTEHDVLKHLIALLKSGKRRDEAFKAELQVLREKIGAEFAAGKAEAKAA